MTTKTEQEYLENADNLINYISTHQMLKELREMLYTHLQYAQEVVNQINDETTLFTPMYALLTDGIVIKEGDEENDVLEGVPCWVTVFKSDILIKYNKSNYFAIRRRLSTMEDVNAFWKESKDCEE